MRRWRPGGELRELRRALARGVPLVIPTESSYGLGVDPRDPRAVDAVYRIKERERGRPLPVVAASREQIERLGVVLDRAEVERWARYWPAALTLVLPCDRPWPAAAGTGSLGVRIPDHPDLRALLKELDCPLTATSANPSGAPPVLDPEEAARWLADEDVVLIDGGPLPGGLPSTVVRPELDGGATVLREGGWRE